MSFVAYLKQLGEKTECKQIIKYCKVIGIISAMILSGCAVKTSESVTKEDPSITTEVEAMVVQETEDANVYMKQDRFPSFYGIWCGASKSESEANNIVLHLNRKGFDGRLFVSADWSNLNSEKWYVITAGVYSSKEAANVALPGVQTIYTNAYVKYSGAYRRNTDINAITPDRKKVDRNSVGVSPGDFILSECDIRIYTKEELSSLSKAELRMARNEIYARHGRIFSAEDVNAYFSGKQWYTPQYEAVEFDTKGDSMLNEYEIANRNLIMQLESGMSDAGNMSEASETDFIGEFYLDISRDIVVPEGMAYIRINITDISQDTIYGITKQQYADGWAEADFSIGTKINSDNTFLAYGTEVNGESEWPATLIYELAYKDGKPVVYYSGTIYGSETQLDERRRYCSKVTS